MKRKITGMFICMLLISAAIFSVTGIVNEELMPLSSYSFGSESITWDAMLNFSEPGGMSDYVIFGEATDANDGEPPDIYDAPKPPLPIPPYLLAWFDDGLSSPYHDLWHDYRMYPDTFKVWDLYVRWKSTDATSINIDMTWDVSEFTGIEYEYIILNRYNRSTGEWDFATNLLTENYYTYAPEYFMEQWIIDHFQINAYVNRPPYVPSSPDPVDGATDVDVDANLSWNGGDPDPGNTVTYDVYFGTNNPPPQVIWNQSTALYNPGTMNYNVQYYWRVVAWDNHGVSAEELIWNFTTQAQPNEPPYEPSNPDPPSGETNVSIGTGLSWSGGDPNGDPVTYDGYFGITNPPPLIFSNQSETTYEIFGTLDYETMYFWKIVAWDNHSASTTGPIWTFTTEEPFAGWECPLDFTEPDSGYDNVFFGEKTDASDGQDSYDIPKSPPGMTPYIRAWFDTTFPDPHNTLLKEYKHYPDTYKVWNLSVQWVPDDYTSPADITISWNMSCLNTDEYTCNKLKNTGSGEAVNMLLNESYTFNASALTPHHFQIICSNEIYIFNLQNKWNLVSLPFNQSVPKDNIIVCYNGVDYSWENATSNNNPTGGPIVLGYMYCWNTSTPQHYDLSDVFEPGYAYWMYAFYDCELWTGDFGSTINDGYITDLLTTWNLMGLPNDVPLPKEYLIVRYNETDYSWENATSNNNPTGGSLILEYIYYWNTITPQHYDLSDVFELGYGYWVYAYHNCTLFYPTTMIMSYMNTDNNAVAPLSDSPIEWNMFDSTGEVTLDFTEPDGGYDNVFFGEKTDASDGQDIYDVPKSPSPPEMMPYIRAWFDTTFPDPHNTLLKEYKHYPDTYKVWNLSVQWVPDDYTSPADITISWNTTEIDAIEYNSVVLFDVSTSSVVADMLVDTEYTFTAAAMCPKDFHIICSIDEPPVPDLDCDGELRWLDIRPCDTATGEFTVRNIGDPGSLLDWEITEWPDFGEWFIDPICGDDLKPEDGPVTVHASIIAPEMEREYFFGSIEIINKNNHSDSDTINVYLFTISWMTIEKPTNALYINNEKIIPFIVPVIVGRINVEVNTSSIVDTVMFFIDEEPQYVDTIPPFTWTWDKIKFFRHTLKIIIYEDNRIIDVDELIVWKFF